ncbi:MAG: Uma2 family endonuclease, partial [Saprospiraceae bacterium]
EDDFVKIVPDFVAEVRSRSDRLAKLQKKMADSWMANGVRLGWLIDPYSEQVHIYRQGQEVEILKGFSGKKLSGEDVLPGFELPLDKMQVKV